MGRIVFILIVVFCLGVLLYLEYIIIKSLLKPVIEGQKKMSVGYELEKHILSEWMYFKIIKENSISDYLAHRGINRVGVVAGSVIAQLLIEELIQEGKVKPMWVLWTNNRSLTIPKYEECHDREVDLVIKANIYIPDSVIESLRNEIGVDFIGIDDIVFSLGNQQKLNKQTYY